MKLNIGCWQNRIEGWLNADIYRKCYCPSCLVTGAEVVADIRSLPFADGSCEAVMMGHVLEHILYEEVTPALREVDRVLQPDGRVCILGPDYDQAGLEYESGRFGTDMRPFIWGRAPGIHGSGTTAEYEGQSSEDHPGADHQWCSTGPLTLELTLPVFPNARETRPIAEVYADEYWCASGPDEWQFCILAEKVA